MIINYGMLDVIWGRDVSWGIETIRWDRQKVHVEDKENWFGKGSTTLASWTMEVTLFDLCRLMTKHEAEAK